VTQNAAESLARSRIPAARADVPGRPPWSAGTIFDRRQLHGLPARLWAASRAHYDQVRRTPFILAMAAHCLPWKAYADWLAQLYFVHESLAQAEAVMADHPAGQAMIRSGPVSVPALATDLGFLYGRRWEQEIAAHPVTTVYCTYLRDAAVREIGGFVAHHYARHVEDLAAGPDLAPAVATAYGLEDAGRRFLGPSDTDLWRYRDRYHRLLDTAPFSPVQADEIVAHVRRVHRAYLDVIVELGRCWA
jgi:heme oxygenase (biliverdin-producing, ferredoxin)